MNSSPMNSNTSLHSNNKTDSVNFQRNHTPSDNHMNNTCSQSNNLSHDSNQCKKKVSIEYLAGFEDGCSSMHLQIIQWKEKCKMEYEKIVLLDQVFNSYLLKAQLELDRINGKVIHF